MDNCTFPVDPKILRKQLPTKVLHLPGNLNPWQNPQETCFLRNLYKNSQVNPQKKRDVLVMVGLATKKVEAEPGLVPG